MDAERLEKLKESLEKGYCAENFDGRYSLSWGCRGEDGSVLACCTQTFGGGDNGKKGVSFRASLPDKLVDEALDSLLKFGRGSITHKTDVHYDCGDGPSDGGANGGDYEGIVRVNMERVFPYGDSHFKLEIDFGKRGAH